MEWATCCFSVSWSKFIQNSEGVPFESFAIRESTQLGEFAQLLKAKLDKYKADELSMGEVHYVLI